MRKYIEICRIVNTHGIRGAVKAEPWCDSPSVLAKMKTLYLEKDNEYIPVKVERASVQKNMVLLLLEGIDTVEKAALQRGKVYFADRNDIPLKNGSFLIDDLIGLPVIDAESGVCYGSVTDVTNGASDIYEVKMPNGKTALFPAVKEFIDRIELESGIFVRPIPGIFDDPDGSEDTADRKEKPENAAVPKRAAGVKKAKEAQEKNEAEKA